MSMSFRFKETKGVVAELEVHDPDDSASVEELYRVLLAMRLQLLKAVDVDIDGKLLLELSVCELDGAPVKPSRRRAILSELPARLTAPAPESSVSRPSVSPREPLRAA